MSLIVRHRIYGLLLAAALFGVDQWVKGLMKGPLKLRETGLIELVPFFDLRWTENYGVSLGLFTATSAEMRWMLVAMTFGIAMVVLVWMLREKKLGDILALGLALGGAFGNIRDRVLHGYVIDYADLHFGEFRPFLIFNIADAAITIGFLFILARSLLSRDKPKPASEAAPES